MDFEVLVQEKRAELLENVHIGMICGVNEQFETKYQVGDTEHYTFSVLLPSRYKLYLHFYQILSLNMVLQRKRLHS